MRVSLENSGSGDKEWTTEVKDESKAVLGEDGCFG